MSGYTPSEVSKKQKASKAYFKSLEALNQKYAQAETSSPTNLLSKIWQGILSYLPQLDFASTLDRAHFLERKHTLSTQYSRQMLQLEREHLLSLLQSQEMHVKEESVGTPFTVKQLVLSHGAVLVHGAQLSLNTPGYRQEQSYGFEKDWALKACEFASRELESEEMISALQTLEQDSQRESIRFATEGNLKHINPTIEKYSHDQERDKQKTSIEFRHKKPLNKQFIAELIKQLEKPSSEGLLLELSSSQNGHGHTLALIKDKNGLWLHDQCAGCFYFPNPTDQNDELSAQFSKFLTSFHAQAYPQFNEAFLIQVKQKPSHEFKNDASTPLKSTRSKRWIPGMKEALKQTTKLNTEKPSNNTKHTPNKPKLK